VTAFVTVPGDRRSEVPPTLAEPVPQALSLVDQFGLWGNLGVSLLGFTGAIFVLQPGGAGTPELSLAAALTATVVGTVLGTLPVALAGLPGAQTGAPAMVLLRGLLGARLSYLPTALNILQCIGWSVFELVTIATAAHTVAPALPKAGYVLIGGVATALLTIRPLGAIRVLRRYATTAVLLVMAYLLVQLARRPIPSFTHGTWSGYWAATDTVVAVAISWVPLVADYTRHSRTRRAAFTGALAGYSVTQVLCYVIGLLALVTVAHGNPNDIYGAFIALPVGALGFAVLAARELDQAFADVYSTAVSVQNLRPLWDRRVLAGAITALATAGALWLNIADYENFLTLIGSVFVPMSAVLIADWFVVSARRWDLSAAARPRWLMLLPWAAGFVTYQLINPGSVPWWASAWMSFGHDIGFTPASWMSASILSFAVAAAVTLLAGAARRLARRLARLPRRPVRGAVRVLAVPRGRRPAGRDVGVIHLQGGVRDAVLAGEELLQVGPHGMAVPARRDEHVRGGGGHPRGDLPDMQVVHLGDVRARRHRGADRLRVQPRRRRLQEDPPGVPDQPGPGVQHQRHHGQRGDRVGAGEPGQHDDQAGRGGGRERVQVGDDVPERPGHVEAVAAVPGRPADQQRGREVHRHPGQRDAEHRRAGHRRRAGQPPDRGVAEPRRQQHQGDAVGLGGHDLGAFQAVGVPAAGRPGRQPGGDQHQRDRRGVGQHVRGVGDQRERVRGEARGDLPGHERHDQRQGSRQPPGVRAGRGAVRVPAGSCHHLDDIAQVARRTAPDAMNAW
jgi:NCS1 family nucleobase:cation symporter-1